MHLPPEEKPTIGYVVSTWPRLSQTVVLTEILALERRGLPVRIFSIKDPRGEPVHAKLAKVRAPVAYLSFRRHGRPILLVGEPVHAKLAKVRAPVAYLSFRRHGRPILLANLRIARDLWPILLPPSETAAELKDDPEDREGGRVEPCLN